MTTKFTDSLQFRADVLAKVKSIIIGNLNLDLEPSQIDDDSPLFGTGLGLDSIDALDLVIGIEEGFSIKVGEDELYVFKSVNSLVDFVLDRQSGESSSDSKHQLGTEMIAYDSGEILGEESRAVYTSLRTTTLLFEDHRVLLRFPEGEETLSALRGVLTGKILDLEPNRILHTALVDDAGLVVDLVYVFQFETHYWVSTSPGNTRALEILHDLAVECDDESRNHRAIVLEGPYSWAVAKEVFGFEVLGLSYQRFIEISFEGVPLVLARMSATGEYGFRVFAPAQEFDKIMAALRANGVQEFHEVVASDLLEEVARVSATEMRMPILGVTVRAGTTLVENELRWMIDYTNEEMVSRLPDSDSKIVAIRVEGLAPGETLESGARITSAEGETVGTVLYTVHSSSVELPIGYAAFVPSHAFAGITTLEVAERPEVRVCTVSTPFFLPTSSRVQMQ
jgi:acyl carrier protein